MEDARVGERVVIATMIHHAGTVGVQTHVTQVAEVLRDRGHVPVVVRPGSYRRAVTAVVLTPGRLLRRLGLESGVLLDRLVHRKVLELALRREFERSRPTIVYAQDPRSAEAAMSARSSSRLPVVLVVHYNESQAQELVERRLIAAGGKGDRSIRGFERRVLSSVDGLVFVSHYVREHVLNSIPAARDIPSIVLANFLPDAPVDTEVVKTRDCICVGSLIERKNQAYLLHVLAAARERGEEHTLTLVGDGPTRGELRFLARQLGVGDLVWFAGSRDDVDDLLRMHRVYVHSATMENMPFALLEALRAGLPVVASAVGGIPEILENGGAGRYWDLADPMAGAETLSGLLRDDSEMARASTCARERFTRNFSTEAVAGPLLEFLHWVMHETRTRE